MELIQYFHRRVGDIHLARDLCQDCFLKLQKSGYNLSAEDGKRLLYGIAKNHLVDYLRKKRRFRDNGWMEESLNTDDCDYSLGMESVGPEQIVASQQELYGVLAAISVLPPKCREVFVLHRLHGLKHREIAEKIGISRSMVEKHIIEAVTKLLNAKQKPEDF